MGRLDYSTRSRVVDFSQRNYRLRYIQAHLNEDIEISKKSLCLLIKKYKNTGTVADARRARRPRKLQDQHYRFTDDAMVENDQLTSRQLHHLLQEAFPGVEVSISTIKRARRELGWVGKRTRYCALISDNKEKRVSWCQDQLDGGDFEFENVIWTDECTVQLESHRRWTFYRVGEPAVNRLKMKPKHPPKINVWAEISARGAT